MQISNIHENIIVMKCIDTRFFRNVFVLHVFLFLLLFLFLLRLVVLNPIKHSFSFSKHYLSYYIVSFKPFVAHLK